jgi:hypothetical protein
MVKFRGLAGSLLAFLVSMAAQTVVVAGNSPAKDLLQLRSRDQGNVVAANIFPSPATPLSLHEFKSNISITWQSEPTAFSSIFQWRQPMAIDNPLPECPAGDGTTCSCPFGPNPNGTGCLCPPSRPVCPTPSLAMVWDALESQYHRAALKITFFNFYIVEDEAQNAGATIALRGSRLYQ